MQNEPVQQTQLETGIKSRQDSSSRSDRLFWGNINHFNNDVMTHDQFNKINEEEVFIFSDCIKVLGADFKFTYIWLN